MLKNILCYFVLILIHNKSFAHPVAQLTTQEPFFSRPLFLSAKEQSILRSLRNTYFGNTIEDQIKRSDHIIELWLPFLKHKNIEFKTVELDLPHSPLKVRALQILPSEFSPQNKEAKRVSDSMGGIKLILAPYYLGSSTSAYYDFYNSYIGVDYLFLTSQAHLSYSYMHEIFHAETFAKLRSQTTTWAGHIESKPRTKISLKNHEGYNQVVSLDEIQTTAFSLKMDGFYLKELRKNQNDQQFFESRSYADDSLGEVLHKSKVGQGLAKQLVDVCDRSLAALNSSENFKVESAQIKLGESFIDVFKSVIFIDSYQNRQQAIVSGGHENVVHHGTKFELLWKNKPTVEQIITRLNEIKIKSQSTVQAFVDVEKSIKVLIEYPRLEGTDINQVFELSQKPFSLVHPE